MHIFESILCNYSRNTNTIRLFNAIVIIFNKNWLNDLFQSRLKKYVHTIFTAYVNVAQFDIKCHFELFALHNETFSKKININPLQ